MLCEITATLDNDNSYVHCRYWGGAQWQSIIHGTLAQFSHMKLSFEGLLGFFWIDFIAMQGSNNHLS